MPFRDCFYDRDSYTPIADLQRNLRHCDSLEILEVKAHQDSLSLSDRTAIVKDMQLSSHVDYPRFESTNECTARSICDNATAATSAPIQG